MAVPKKKTSKSKRNMRRSHDFQKAVNVSHCKNCGKAIVSHNICPFCHYYAGRNTSVFAEPEVA